MKREHEMKNLKKLANIGLLLAGIALAGAGQAQAGSNKAELNVQLEITQGCSVGFGSGSNGEGGKVNLGSFINLDEQKTADINLNVRCSKDSNIGYTVALNGGNSGDYTNRVLRNEGGKEIAYNIYKDSGYTQKWGDKDPDWAQAKEFTKNGDIDTHPVYIQVPAQPGVALYSGKYTDTVVATVSYN